MNNSPSFNSKGAVIFVWGQIYRSGLPGTVLWCHLSAGREDLVLLLEAPVHGLSRQGCCYGVQGAQVVLFEEADPLRTAWRARAGDLWQLIPFEKAPVGRLRRLGACRRAWVGPMGLHEQPTGQDNHTEQDAAEESSEAPARQRLLRAGTMIDRDGRGLNGDQGSLLVAARHLGPLRWLPGSAGPITASTLGVVTPAHIL